MEIKVKARYIHANLYIEKIELTLNWTLKKSQNYLHANIM